MADFTEHEQAISRVVAAREAVAAAMAAPGSAALRAALDELEDSLRHARDLGVTVPPPGEPRQEEAG